MSNEKYVVFNFEDKEIALMNDRPTNVKKILDINSDMSSMELRDATLKCDTILEDAMLSIVMFRLKMEELLGASEIDCIIESIMKLKWDAFKINSGFLITLRKGQDESEFHNNIISYYKSKSMSSKDNWECFAGKSNVENENDYPKKIETETVDLGWGTLNLRRAGNVILVDGIDINIIEIKNLIDNGLDVDMTCIDSTVNNMQAKIKALEEELEALKKLNEKN